MKVLVLGVSFLLCFAALLEPSGCQLNYVPAQILIPTLNGSYYPPNNQGWNQQPQYNYSQASFNRPPQPQYNNYHGPPQYGFNPSVYNGSQYGYNNYSSRYNNSSYNNSGPSNSYLNPSNNGKSDGHLFLGAVHVNDRLLFSQEYYKPSRWWTNREKIISYPEDLPSGYTRHETISAIRVINQFHDGHSARAQVLKGGIGRSFVKIKLYSKTGKGFRFLVQILGH